MTKKILVVTGSFFGNENAMSNAVLPLLRKLQEDYAIDVYTYFSNYSEAQDETINGFHIFRDKAPVSGFTKYYRKIGNLMYRIQTIDTRTITKRKWVPAIKMLKGLINTICRDKTLRLSWNLTVEDLLARTEYNAVISISSPIRVQADCLNAYKKGIFKKNGTKWIAYYLDPFATYYGNLNQPFSSILMDFESEVYAAADYIVTTPEIKKDNINYPTSKYDSKVIPIQLANLDFNKFCNCADYPFNKDKYNCVYTGSFFDVRIRNPKRLFQIISRLNDDIEVYLICYLMNDTVEGYREQYLKGRKNIHWVGRTDIHECFDMMNSADVLINVGNESANQTPSKVFDYISCFKPIINFYSIDNDTSKKYLYNYPCKINVCNSDADIDLQVENVSRFIYGSKTQCINKEKVKYRYYELSSDFISAEFAKNIHDILDN